MSGAGRLVVAAGERPEPSPNNTRVEGEGIVVADVTTINKYRFPALIQIDIVLYNKGARL